jgi:hypothetical protein
LRVLGTPPVEPLVRRVLTDALSDLQRHYPGHREHISAHDLTAAEVVELLDTDDMADRYLEMLGHNPEQTPWTVRRSLSAYFSKRLAAEYEGFVRRWPAT